MAKITTTRRSRAGTKIQGKHFYEEYLGTLQFPNAYDIYDKMRRSDYQIFRLLNAITSPIKSGVFEYKPIDPKDEEQVKQATFKNKFYNDWAIDDWGTMLHQMLSYLAFGFAIFEPYAHLVDDPEMGKVWTLKSLGQLRQSTIREWTIKDGIVKSIHQQVTTNDEFQSIDIDGNNLLIFTNMKEGDNYEGVSILRPVYGNYIRKDLYLRLDMIGIERMAIGVPVFFLPKGTLDDPEERAKIVEIAESYCAHESQYLLLPDVLKGGTDNSKQDPGFYIQEGKYDSAAVQSSIQREDTKIMDSMLASFADIGVYRAGGNSQNEGQMELFLNSLLSIAEYVAKKRDFLSHQYYVYNFGQPKKRIDTTVSNITKNDAVKMMEIIQGYVNADVIRADERLEEEVRSDLKLPKKDMATERENSAKQDKNLFRTPEGQETPQKNPQKTKTSEK